MPNDTTIVGPNPSGLCMCGCGQKTEIAWRTQSSKGHVAGKPKRYIYGHSRRGIGTGLFLSDEGYLVMKRVVRGVVTRTLLHVFVWESHNGPKPDGCEIHHVDRDKTNNQIDNLQLLTHQHHVRIHRGWKLLPSGEWMKPCNTCCSILPTSAFYPVSTTSAGFTSECIECQSARKTKRLKVKS